MEILVDILILNWNGFELTRNCIKSIKKHCCGNYRIIVVDNDSKDGSSQKLKNVFEDVVILQSDTNLGYAGGNNFGLSRILEERKSKYTLVLNNDTEAEDDFLTKLVQIFEEDQQCGLVTPIIFYLIPKDKKIVWGIGGKVNFWIGKFRSRYQGVDYLSIHKDLIDNDIDYVTGCCFLIKNDLAKDLNLFKENYFAYYEDTDLSFRVKEKGFKLRVSKDSFIRHVAGASTKNEKKGLNPLVWYLNIRNQIWFFKRHAKPYHYITYPIILIFKLAFFVLVFMLKRNFKKINFAIRGFFDGVFYDDSSFKKCIPH